jgi:hypothetical protein
MLNLKLKINFNLSRVVGLVPKRGTGLVGPQGALHKKCFTLSEPEAVATGQRFTLRIVTGSVRFGLGPVATPTRRGSDRGPADRLSTFLCEDAQGA